MRSDQTCGAWGGRDGEVGPTFMSRSISASRLTMVILCMTMSMILRSRDCHLSLAALLKLWLAPFFWNFFLGGRGKGALAGCSAALLGPLPRSGSRQPRHQSSSQTFTLPSSPWSCPQSPQTLHLAGRLPLTVAVGWSPRKWLIFRFH